MGIFLSYISIFISSKYRDILISDCIVTYKLQHTAIITSLTFLILRWERRHPFDGISVIQ